MTSLEVDTASSTPVWEQLHDQLVRFITGGQLAHGTRLPSIRQLAGDLGVAPGTIARTYAELESAGWVHTRRPQGTFVAAHASNPKGLLAELADTFARQAKQLGIPRDEATRALRAAYDG